MMAENNTGGVVTIGQPQRYRCTRGHGWTTAWGHGDDAFSLNVVSLPGSGDKRFCLRCVLGRLAELCGTVEPVPKADTPSVVEEMPQS